MISGPIPYYTRYCIDSDTAEVFLIELCGLRKIPQRITSNGYMSVKVFSDSSREVILQSVHRLVALAFIPIPEKMEYSRKLQVNHKDGNKLNNHVSNLEWCFQSYNISHCFNSFQHGRAREVIVYYFFDDVTVVYPSITQAAKYLGVVEGTLWEWINRTGNGRMYQNRCYVNYYDGNYNPKDKELFDRLNDEYYNRDSML